MAIGHGFKVKWGFSAVRTKDIGVIFYGETLHEEKRERVNFSWQHSKFFTVSSKREEVVAFASKAAKAVSAFSETRHEENDGFETIKSMINRICAERAELGAPLEHPNSIFIEAVYDKITKDLKRMACID